MTKIAGFGALTLIIGIALVLGACGAKDQGATTSASAKVTFTSDPIASVWIDGKENGETPLVLELATGSHEVCMKREGFVPITQTLELQAGKHITVNGDLPVSGSDTAALRRLLAMIDTEYEPFADASTHRGAGPNVTLYFPAGMVRREGLSTYRVEVSDEYDGTGYIEFRKSGKVIFREKFEPDTYVTERALPATVLEAARNGSKLEWGVTYDNKRRQKDEALADFEVVPKSRERKISANIERTMSRKAIRTASPLLQEMAQVTRLKGYRLYSEVLMRSLGILNTWEDTELPYRNMVDALQRLKLKDSSLYQFVSSKVLGAGGTRLLGKGGESPLGSSARIGAGGGAGVASTEKAATGRPSSLPSVAISPVTRRNDSASGVQPQQFGVQPTDQGTEPAQAADASNESDAAAEGARPQATGGDGGRALRRLRLAAREAELRAESAETAEQNLAALAQELTDMAEEVARIEAAANEAQTTVEAARSALAEAQADSASTPDQIAQAEATAEAAEASALAAEQARANASRDLGQMEERRQGVEEELRRILTEVGPAAEANQEATNLRRKLAAAEQAAGGQQSEDGSGQGPHGGFTPPAPPPSPFQHPDDPATDDPAGQQPPPPPHGSERNANGNRPAPGNLPGPGSQPGPGGQPAPGSQPAPNQRPGTGHGGPMGRARLAIDDASKTHQDAQVDAQQAQEAVQLAEVESERAQQEMLAAQQAVQAGAEARLEAATADRAQRQEAYDDLVAAGAAQAQIDAARAALDAADAEAAQRGLELAAAVDAQAATEADAARAQMELERARAAQQRAEQDLHEAEVELSRLKDGK